jgi:DNA (cytosine-5)-methyltransferase 1
MKSVELFSGCGGLALGLSRAGFEHVLMVERNENAVSTIEHNRQRGVEHVRDWTVTQDDVRDIDWTPHEGSIDLVAGGPPCQPFSIGGIAAGHLDERDMWPEAIRAVDEMWPKAFLFENVRGLGRPIFRDYFEWIQAALGSPHIHRRKREDHASHKRRLKREEPAYKVIALSVNAADFGAPQKRHRIIVAGVRADLGIDIAPPERGHSKERLEWEQDVTGNYWRKHRLGRNHQRNAADEMLLVEPEHQPWVTVRDTFQGLGKPNNRGNHVLQPGARQYTGHTGSAMDEPAKALKAGVHGVPGGENMVVLDDGAVRYFTIREAARLQGLPDDYEFDCAWSEAMRQLGNAVPAQMSEQLGIWMRSMIERT